MTTPPAALRLSTTEARDRLSEIITRVQDPRAFAVLTRHGRPVAAIVSMAELRRIFDQQDVEDVVAGRVRPVRFVYGKGLEARTNREAAEAVQRMQMDRRTEREVLARASLEPVPGGELEMEVEVPVTKRRWWRWW